MSENQETDVWWGSYAGRGLAPHFAVAVLATLAIAAAAWVLWDVDLASWQLTRYTAYGLAGLVWLWQLSLWGHRTVSWNYRLTTRCIYCDRGFRRPGNGRLELADVLEVRVQQSSWQKFLGIGTVCIQSEKDPTNPLLLEGVADPERIAAEIRQQTARAHRAASCS